MRKKPNPLDKQAPKKWYAVTKSGAIADVELAAAAKLIAKWVYNQLIQGKRAKIPGLGTFRITFGSEGVENIEDFHTGLIRNVKLSLIPDKTLRANILRDLRFENAGVVDEGTYYGSLENYKQVKGIAQGGTGTTTPGTGEDDGDHQLG